MSAIAILIIPVVMVLCWHKGRLHERCRRETLAETVERLARNKERSVRL